MLLSIITPAYDEEEIISKYVKSLTEFLKKERINYELVIVENGSTDKTLDILKTFAKSNHHLKIIHLQKPSYGQALRYGLSHAKGDPIIIFSVDFWDKDFLLKATKNNLYGADLLVGSKNLPESRDKRPFIRRLISKSYGLFLKIFFGYQGTDTHGLKAFRRSVITANMGLCKLSNSLFDSELHLRIQRAGGIIYEIPVSVREIRLPRFKRRLLTVPKELWQLYRVLR